MNKSSAVAALGASALAVIALTSNAPADSALFLKQAAYEPLTKGDMDFIKFVAKHNKSYGTKQEFAFRAEQYKKNMAAIEAINADPEMTSTAGENHLADMTPAELKKLNGYRAELKTEYNPRLLATTDLPNEVNWVEAGAVTPVKNQGQCGSCWSFSTTGAVEGAEFLATGTLQSFSEQQLVDCAGGSWGNYGCNGGLMDYAFKYIESNPLELESDYAYKAYVSSCAYKKSKAVGNVKGFVDVAQGSPSQMKAALAKGPVSVAIEADQSPFQFYTSGVLTKGCGQQLDHGVLAVGFGVENGVEYFLVKNSWGPNWGAKGFIKIGASSANTCGILSAASYPTE